MHMSINCIRTNRHRGKASTINFEIFEKCEYQFNISFFRKNIFQQRVLYHSYIVKQKIVTLYKIKRMYITDHYIINNQ